MEEPKNFTVYDFKCCSNYGGAAFRHWTMLMKHKGIFFGWDNYKYVEYASSDPAAKWGRGCQESCAHGNPMPYSDSATLIPLANLPEEAQKLARKWVKEAHAIAEEKIKKHKENKEKEEKRRREAAAREYEQNIVNPWTKAVNDNGL